MDDSDLLAASRLPAGHRRTAALAAWFQGLFPPGMAPVLVGGAAVELFTGGAYATGDLDFVGDVPGVVAQHLRAAGFERRGRHWVHETLRLFIELPGRVVRPASKPVRIIVGDSEVLAIAPEALLADRLAAWKFWGSSIDAANALRLLTALGARINPRLAAKLARELDVEDERRRLVRFVRRLGGRAPTETEMERWLKGKR